MALVPIETVLQRIAEAGDDSTRRALLEQAPAQWRASLAVLIAGPEPTVALHRALALPPEVRQRPFGRALSRLLHQGNYPARLCALVPAAVDVLADDADPDATIDAAGLTEEFAQALRARDPDSAIGAIRTREYLRLSRREVEAAPLERVGTELCTLASCLLEALLRDANLEQTVVVFGMGKLGGGELNFLSDIDLVFIHRDNLSGTVNDDPTPDTAERAAVIELHRVLRRIVKHVEGTGPWRPVFRVDLRLRPFGSRGPLSMSESATEAYYERHGRPWERQAWLRARPVAGSRTLGESVQRRLRPFVYRRSVTPAIFDEVTTLMARARRDTAHASGNSAGLDLKLDDGGIRTVEFTVQALQLLHAGKNASLRSPSTLRSLDRLLAAGLVSDREHAELTDAYRFFRRVEHRVQLAEGVQTHTVPTDDDARRLLAARLGISPAATDAGDPLPALDRIIAEHRQRVQSIAATLSGTADDDHGPVATVLDSGAPPAVRRNALAELGLRDPGEAEGLLAHLYARDDAALNARGPAARGAERLLAACLDSADPDMALVRFARFSRDRPAHYGVWRFFAEPPDPGWDLLRMTAELLGSSETLSAGLIGFAVGRGALPDDTVGVLQAASESPLSDPHAVATAMRDAPIDPRGVDATMLRFKHRELVRLGVHDLAGRPDPLVVGRALSDLADAVVRVVIRDLAADPTWRDGPPVDLAVLAAGKCGAQAMDYGSDLDLVFVYAAPEPGRGADAGTPATRFAQRLIARLSDRALGIRLYEIDTRLRPSGRQGLLVTSAAAFARYHARALPVWEKLAMLRLRPIAEVRLGGLAAAPDLSATAPPAPTHATMASALPGPLCAEASQIVTDHLFRRDETVTAPAVAAAVGDLKLRIERELAREGRAHFNAKSGVGGCLELELLVSALQLLHGHDNEAVRRRGIDDAIVGLSDIEALPAGLATTLRANYRFLRLLLNRLRMSHAGGFDDPDRFSENSPKLPTLARRMGLPDADGLLHRYRTCRAAVRAALVTSLPDCPLPVLSDSD